MSATGGDDLLVWTAQRLPDGGARAWALGEAVVVACPQVSKHDRLAVWGAAGRSGAGHAGPGGLAGDGDRLPAVRGPGGGPPAGGADAGASSGPAGELHVDDGGHRHGTARRQAREGRRGCHRDGDGHAAPRRTGPTRSRTAHGAGPRSSPHVTAPRWPRQVLAPDRSSARTADSRRGPGSGYRRPAPARTPTAPRRAGSGPRTAAPGHAPAARPRLVACGRSMAGFAVGGSVPPGPQVGGGGGAEGSGWLVEPGAEDEVAPGARRWPIPTPTRGPVCPGCPAGPGSGTPPAVW